MRIHVLSLTVVGMLVMPPVWAATLTCTDITNGKSCGPVTVTAQVDPQLVLDCTLVKCLNADCSSKDTTVTSMSFGDLLRRFGPPTCTGTTPADGEACALVGDHHYRTFCGANTSGRSYTITHTGTSLASGANTLDSAWIVHPVFKGTAAGTLGACNLAKNTQVLYTGSDGGGATVETVYAITDTMPPSPAPATCPAAPAGFAVIGPDQTAGTYAGTVTVEMTASP